MQIQANVVGKSLATVASLLVWIFATTSAAGPLEINQSCATSPNGCFSGDAPGFPVEITSAGSYVLTGDLTISDIASEGIAILALGPVSLDLRGFTIRGPAICTGSGATLSCTPGSGWGVHVRNAPGEEEEPPLRLMNGTITGFAEWAVFARSPTLFSNLTVTRNGRGIQAYPGSILANCVAQENSGEGFNVPRGVIHDSTAGGNSDDGFVADWSIIERSSANGNGVFGMDVSRSLVRSVAVTQNEGGGLRMGSTYGLTSESSVSLNSLDGITALGGHVQRNTIRSNGQGGLVIGAAASYHQNTISDSGSADLVDGFSVGVDLGGNACGGTAICP